VALFSHTWATTMLGTPHVVSGVVFDDWNSNGIRDGFEPGISSVVVSLWYLPAGQYSVLQNPSKYVQVGTYYTRIGADSTSGTFQFNCLAAGSYKVAVNLASTRPGTVSPVPASSPAGSTVNEIISVSNGMGWTAPFEAEEAGSTNIGIGLVQTIFAVAFSLTGDQTVPPTVSTTVGAGYAVLNVTGSEMYFRIIRGEWSSGEVEEPGGFYQGWADEAPGFQVRSLADLSDIKENVWFIPRQSFVDDLLNGRMLVQLSATGSFSDKSRLRGQFARFRRSTYLQTMIDLEGSEVVPLVSTSVEGSATFFLDIMRQQLDYEITYSSLNDDMETSATINGPATVGQTGPVLFQLPLGAIKSGSISGLSETAMTYLSKSMVYVSINTANHPNGVLRGQVRAWQQVQYQSVMSLQPQSTGAGVQTFGHAVTQLDLERQTLSYFIAYGGLSNDEYTANITRADNGDWFDLEGEMVLAYQDGVKQGFYYLTSDQINGFLQGKYMYVIRSRNSNDEVGEIQTELQSSIHNWS